MIGNSWKTAGLVLGLVFSLTCSFLQAGTLEDDFNDGTLDNWPTPNVGGSALTNPGTGGNPGGYLQASRATGFTQYYLSDKYTGDWSSMVSQQLVMSFDLDIQDVGQIGTLIISISNPTFSDLWNQQLYAQPTFPLSSDSGWVHFDIPIDTSWTNAQAKSNGWYTSFPSGSPQTFSQVLDNVQGAYTGLILADVSTPVTLTGLDNFKVAPLLAGNVNYDNIVNSQDLAVISSNWLGEKSSGKTLSGDANFDGIVNSQDLALVSSNWLQTAGPGVGVAVPEPATLALTTIALLSFCCSSVRKRLRSWTAD